MKIEDSLRAIWKERSSFKLRSDMVCNWVISISSALFISKQAFSRIRQAFHYRHR